MDKSRSLKLIIGTFLMALAYKTVFDSVGMVTGGFSGIGIIVKRLTVDYVPGGVPMWLVNVVLNTPVFIAGYIMMGKRFLLNTFAGTVLLTLFLALLPSGMVGEADYLIAALAGGVLYGGGLGLVLNAGATTGGTDLLAVLMSKCIKGASVIRLLQMIDGAVILIGAAVFGVRVSLYAMIAIYIGTLVSDRIVEGAKSAKAVWIITDRYSEVSSAIMTVMKRGVTMFNATGMYSCVQRSVLLCVVSKKQIPLLKEIVHCADDNVFLIIGDVREVCGEGFVKN